MSFENLFWRLLFSIIFSIKPSFEGIKFFEQILVKDLVDYIDWTPFFNAWGFKSSYPKILKDKKMKNEANKLFEDANKL